MTFLIFNFIILMNLDQSDINEIRSFLCNVDNISQSVNFDIIKKEELILEIQKAGKRARELYSNLF